MAVATNDVEYTAQVPIGYDDQTEFTISVFTAFLLMPGAGAYEHVFYIVDADPGDPTRMYTCWDGLDTVNLFNREDREGVLNVVCAATRALLGTFSPPKVFHIAHPSRVPEKTMRKHQIIMGVFEEGGYRIHVEPPHNGQYSWVAEK